MQVAPVKLYTRKVGLVMPIFYNQFIPQLQKSYDSLIGIHGTDYLFSGDYLAKFLLSPIHFSLKYFNCFALSSPVLTFGSTFTLAKLIF